MSKRSNEELYVLAVLSGVVRAEIEKLKEHGVRTMAARHVDPQEVLRVFKKLLKTIEDHTIPF